MEQYDHNLASTRVHALDFCPRKALCFRSMFQLLYQLPSCGLDTSPNSTQVAPVLDCIELLVALASTIPWVSPPLTLSVPSYDVALDCSPT
ncbi:hypothetical protein B296_00028289 [Ensete ventricosum]|uniref:Uncharacterized protein n=1 Tax=Ensete ventricosum TaxID=4639 RepID=A0A426X565_ENSVE|nr:hypothetical protein B296_00028289 [Ensete ventricosum]